MKSVDRMSLSELRELNSRVEAAIQIARDREAKELRQQLTEMAAKSGFKLAELFGSNAGAKATLRKTLAPKYRDRETGVPWAGRGRYPKNFDRSRAEIVSA